MIIVVFIFLGIDNLLVVAILLFFLCTILDFCDGCVARYNYNSSFYGRFIDGLVDIIQKSWVIKLDLVTSEDDVNYSDVRDYYIKLWSKKSDTDSITPQNIIDLAKKYFDKNQLIITEVDKKAYLSALKLSNHIIVTCDSTSMISEAAMTGKPIYVAQMTPVKKNSRFRKFYELFKSLNIIKDLENSLETWDYNKLNETDRISGYIKEKLKNYDFS